MNKRRFTYIMVLMGLSIVGIILVQIIWISNAIQVKNDLFDRGVNEALGQVVQRMEDQQNFRIFTHGGEADSLHWVSRPIPPPPSGRERFPARERSGNYQYKFSTDSVGTSTNHVVFSDDSGRNVRTETIIISNGDSIRAEFEQLMEINLGKIDSLQTALDTIKIISPGMRKRVEVKTRNFEDFTHRFITEMTTIDDYRIPLDQLIDHTREALLDKNIPIHFELAVSERDTLVELSNAADSLNLLASNYAVRLYPHAIIPRESRLIVYFPDQNSFILSSVSWLLAASLIFSLIILFSFSWSIIFMLNQKKISEMKTDFINNMTHEFKTPIATISVASDSILNEKVLADPQRIGYYVDMIKKENKRMNQQVEDILTIARLDKKEFDFNWEVVNVHQLIEEVCDSLVIQVEKRGGSIALNLDADNCSVSTDRVHCANVIFNLLDNANKYSPDQPTITVRTSNVANGICIAVSDRGIGMSKSVQSKIFERFYRQPSGNIHNVKGFGLGLSYVRAVVEANKGKIEVQSEPGK